MGRPTNKTELLAAADTYDKLMTLIDSMTDEELSTPFQFESDVKKTEAHWRRDKNLRDILALAETLSNEELFSKGTFPWVGNSALGSYFVSNTSSHYNWAIKKLKAHKKAVKAM